MNPLPPKRFLDEPHVGPRTILWLNEAQRYLRDPFADIRTGIATALMELLADAREPVLVLGTLRPEHWQELTRTPERTEVDRFAAARRLLNGNYLQVPETFTNAEVTTARQSGNHLLAAAANRVTGATVTQQLAGALTTHAGWAGIATKPYPPPTPAHSVPNPFYVVALPLVTNECAATACCSFSRHAPSRLPICRAIFPTIRQKSSSSVRTRGPRPANFSNGRSAATTRSSIRSRLHVRRCTLAWSASFSAWTT